MTNPIVRVENIVKTFPKANVVALDEVSLEFEPGIVYGLLGPNGAGKTTGSLYPGFFPSHSFFKHR